ncbi:MAG: hypothetical protein ACREYD_14385, partial [Casimicrobiaceae bacterium]
GEVVQSRRQLWQAHFTDRLFLFPLFRVPCTPSTTIGHEHDEERALGQALPTRGRWFCGIVPAMRSDGAIGPRRAQVPPARGA